MTFDDMNHNLKELYNLSTRRENIRSRGKSASVPGHNTFYLDFSWKKLLYHHFIWITLVDR